MLRLFLQDVPHSTCFGFSRLQLHWRWFFGHVFGSPCHRCIRGFCRQKVTSHVFIFLSLVLISCYRTKAFFYASVAMLLSELVSPPLGSVLMERFNPYVPFLTGIPLEMLGYVVLLYIPSTGNHAGRRTSEHGLASSAGDQQQSKSMAWESSFAWLGEYLKNFAADIKRHPGLIVAFFAFMVNKLARQIGELLIQYLSFRFGWTMAQVYSLSHVHISFGVYN